MSQLKKHFVTGLVILLPLVITVAVVVFLVNFLTEPFMGIATSILSKLNLSERVLRYGSKLLILILLFLFTVALGIVARWFLMNFLIRIGDQILHRIPIINTVYKTTQDLIKTLFVSDKNALKQVVMVPFPRADVYVLGLVARDSPAVCSKQAKTDLVSVFIPTTPNPTTGFLLMFKRADLVMLDMKPEEAIKYIISCGVIVPEYKEPQGATKKS